MSENCGFCGKSHKQVKKMIVGDGAAICDECVDLCGGLIRKELPTHPTDLANIDPIAVKEHLDEYVVSQEQAKITLSVAVANHYKRLNAAHMEIEKSNIMLLGPTGSGKTLLAKSIARFLDVPLVVADATCLTESGYVGDDADVVLSKLLQKAGGDVELAQRGIVFIDEVDKIARKGEIKNGPDVSGEGVQQSLLKLVEGSMYEVPVSPTSESTVEIDTSQILFIAAGAFTGLDKIKKQRETKQSIGFTIDTTDNIIDDTNFTDLVNFGLIPEFVGRFPIVSEVDELSESDMLEILTKVKNNLVDQYTNLFSIDDIALSFDAEALGQIVHIATKQKTGARGLRTVMERALRPHMFNMHRYRETHINKVEITKKLITTPTEVKKKDRDAKGHST